ncbi:hypothetical protein [Pelobacter propionicus]|nr:hypothetical protein [Pelobacter propionicus]
MSPTKLKIISSPLSAEYQRMKRWAARDGERAKKLAAAQPTATEVEDSVTISSVQPGENRAQDARTLSQPVTSEERQALMQAFSIRV